VNETDFILNSFICNKVKTITEEREKTDLLLTIVLPSMAVEIYFIHFLRFQYVSSLMTKRILLRHSYKKYIRRFTLLKNSHTHAKSAEFKNKVLIFFTN